MKKYNVIFSIDAKFDIADLKRYIKHELKAPDTAANYIRELNTTIQGLSSYADSIGINEYIQSQFGTNARHIIFKKMTIIYRIYGKYVYVKRVIPSTLIH